jgi:hypothetical protein
MPPSYMSNQETEYILRSLDGCTERLAAGDLAESDLLASMHDDGGGGVVEVEVPLAGVETGAILRCVAEYLRRAAKTPLPRPTRTRSTPPLPDYAFGRVVGRAWEGFFDDAGVCNCEEVWDIMHAAEYMHIDGLRWLCGVKISCDVRRATCNEDLCRMFNVPPERMASFDDDLMLLGKRYPHARVGGD